jgi:transcriptional regulator of acetoin/glycerol metabolism
MEALQAYSWPGNIRELRNVIEHAVIVTNGDTLKVSAPGEAIQMTATTKTLDELQRDHILEALERTGWRIKGPRGAAQKLGLNPSTLYTRMEKLGIPTRRAKEEAGAP